MAMKAQGTKLKRQNVYASDGSGAYTQIPGCRNFTYGLSKQVADTTDLDDDWSDNETTTNSQAPINFDLFFNPAHAMHDELTGVLADFMNDTLRFVELQPRSGKARRTEGKFTQFEESYTVNEVVVYKVTFTPRGVPTFVTAS